MTFRERIHVAELVSSNPRAGREHCGLLVRVQARSAHYLNFIGLGLGPMFTGAVSDTINSYLLSRGVDEPQALGDGLRWALRVTIMINLWSAPHYILAGRTLREDIKSSARA